MRVFHKPLNVAGACPPRALECADDGEGQTLALREEATRFFHRSAGHVTVNFERFMKHPLLTIPEETQCKQQCKQQCKTHITS